MPPYLDPDWQPDFWLCIPFLGYSLTIAFRGLLTGRLKLSLKSFSAGFVEGKLETTSDILGVLDIVALFSITILFLWACLESLIKFIELLFGKTGIPTINPIFHLIGLRSIANWQDFIVLLACTLVLFGWFSIIEGLVEMPSLVSRTGRR